MSTRRQQEVPGVRADDEPGRPGERPAALARQGRREQARSRDRRQQEHRVDRALEHVRRVEVAAGRLEELPRGDAAEAVRERDRRGPGHEHGDPREEVADARDRAREHELERAALELAGDRTHAAADEEERGGAEEERVLLPDRHPRGERVDAEQAERDLHLLRAEVPLRRAEVPEQGHEQQAPGERERHDQRQADALLPHDPPPDDGAHPPVRALGACGQTGAPGSSAR